MSFGDLKISEAAIQSTGVQSQPDTLTGSAPDNKLVFDALPTLIIQKLNSLLDLLGGTGAAGEMPIAPIDGMTATTVQQALAELRQALTAYINLVQGTNGAAQVGVSAISGMTAQNAQAALGELKALIDNLVIGALPPGSVTADMIADGAIVQLGALLAVAAAAAYDPEGSYAVGDYCTYKGKLHKCSTAIPTGETWTEAHWTTTTVAAELAELSSQLSNRLRTDSAQYHKLNGDTVLQLSPGDDLNLLPNGIAYTTDGGTTSSLLHIPPGITATSAVIITESGNGVPNLNAFRLQTMRIRHNNQIYVRFSGEPLADGKESWNDWVKIPLCQSPQEFDLPRASGWSNYSGMRSRHWKNQFDEVSVVVDISNPNTVSHGAVVATLPEGFRPAAAFDAPAIIYDGSEILPVRAYFSTNGQISISGYSNQTWSKVLFFETQASFIAVS